MRNMRLFVSVWIGGFALCVAAQQAPKAAETNILDRFRAEVAAPEHPTHLLLVNKQKRLTEAQMESLRQAAELGLRVPVRLAEDTAPLKTSATAFASAYRRSADTNVVAFVVFVDVPETEVPLLLTALDGRWAIVNLAAMGPVKGEQAVTRAGQAAFRGFASLLGAGYSKDPRSLMVPVQSAAELTQLPTNLEPEALEATEYWGTRFGLPKVSLNGYTKKLIAGEVPPVNPARWGAWEERTGKKARETFKKLGYDADEIAAAFLERAKTAPPKEKRHPKP